MLIAQAGAIMRMPEAADRRGAGLSAAGAAAGEFGGAAAAGLGITGPGLPPAAAGGLTAAGLGGAELDAAGLDGATGLAGAAGLPFDASPGCGVGVLAMAGVRCGQGNGWLQLPCRPPAHSNNIVSGVASANRNRKDEPRSGGRRHGGGIGQNARFSPVSCTLAGNTAGRGVRSAVPHTRNFGRTGPWPRARNVLK